MTENRFQQKGRVKVVKGSIINPENAGLRLVLSTANLSGEVKDNILFPLFEKKWKKVREEARGWFVTRTGAYKLGAINTTAVQSDVWVVHMLCQDDKKYSTDALKECVKKVCAMAKYEKASVHVSNLLLGISDDMKSILEEGLVSQGVSVYFYEE